MPRVEVLNNWAMGVEKTQETDVVRTENGEETLEVADVWTIIYIDRQSGDRIQISFRREARDDLVRQLTGGVVLAGGDLPRV